MLPSSIIFIDNHGQIMGRSWADHGRSIHAKKSWKFQLFPIPFFSEKLWKFAIFPLALSKAFSYFCRPRTCFLGKNCLFSESKINFTPWNRVLLSERSILHLENAMFSKIRPYFLRTFWLSAIKRAHANMRSLNNGWQPARPSKRTCVLFMAGNQHVLQSEHAFS